MTRERRKQKDKIKATDNKYHSPLTETYRTWESDEPSENVYNTILSMELKTMILTKGKSMR